MKSKVLLIFAGVYIFSLYACGGDAVRVPKAHMYPRVSYPEKNYKDFDSTLCSFTFRMPLAGSIVRDSFIFEGEPAHPCWFDINVNALNASIYCSYYQISINRDLSRLINDAYNIAGKHNIKANYRKETIIDNGHNAKGILFDIEGPVASPVQFYLTDEKNHFFRGALYFNSKVNPDSTAPVLSYMKTDIDTLIASFRWK
ncbi:MAG: hypothetical protein IPL55_16290 [Saprospiraceae bacterium]|jgi:gliding motility-associated lipoprotein GldD|nr:hypothetical protein [Saprospiraceae bacterium]MBL0023627.1 hypothetical protein [Saprospiraceae bacterium]